MKEGRVKRGGAPLLPWLNNMSFSQLGPGKRRGKGRGGGGKASKGQGTVLGVVEQRFL